MKKGMFLFLAICMMLGANQSFAQCSGSSNKSQKVSVTKGGEDALVDIAIGSKDHTT